MKLISLLFLGIVTAGTGIGSIISGPVSQFLFKQFGWKVWFTHPICNSSLLCLFVVH